MTFQYEENGEVSFYAKLINKRRYGRFVPNSGMGLIRTRGGHLYTWLEDKDRDGKMVTGWYPFRLIETVRKAHGMDDTPEVDFTDIMNPFSPLYGHDFGDGTTLVERRGRTGMDIRYDVPKQGK